MVEESVYLTMSPNERSALPATSIKDCDQVMFPNISACCSAAILHIPVESCECGSSASPLRRLNSYPRVSIGKSRMSHIPLLHIHYDTFLDTDKVVNRIAYRNPRIGVNWTHFFAKVHIHLFHALHVCVVNAVVSLKNV